MYQIVFLRHGQSVYNAKDIFTGWIDVGLSEKGQEEAKRAGQILKKEGFVFDLVFTSFLKRAIETSQIVIDEMALKNIELVKAWQLNERHYGVLQGKNKKEIFKEYGPEKFFLWRRSFATPPPPLATEDKTNPIFEEKYQAIKPENLPRSECLADVQERVLPYWHKKIVPAVLSGQKILVSIHGSSIRALLKYLDNISDKDVEQLNIPTGIPLVYFFDENLKPIKHYYLGQEKVVKEAIKEVAQQGLQSIY